MDDEADSIEDQDSKIESEVANMPSEDSLQSWQRWKQSPSPAAMAKTLNTVRPVIDRAVSRFPKANPTVLGGEAKRLAISAIKTYDPSMGTSLKSHVFSHLRSLGRNSSNMGKVLNMTRTDRDYRAKYLAAINDLTETHGNEPSDAQLMDHLGVDAKVLTKMRRVSMGEFAEGQAEMLPSVAQQDEEDPRISMWVDYVYNDLPEVDKKIMDLKIGRNGKTPLSAVEVAAKLRLSPDYVNVRAGAIAKKILDGINSTQGEETYG